MMKIFPAIPYDKFGVGDFFFALRLFGKLFVIILALLKKIKKSVDKAIL